MLTRRGAIGTLRPLYCEMMRAVGCLLLEIRHAIATDTFDLRSGIVYDFDGRCIERSSGMRSRRE